MTDIRDKDWKCPECGSLKGMFHAETCSHYRPPIQESAAQLDAQDAHPPGHFFCKECGVEIDPRKSHACLGQLARQGTPHDPVTAPSHYTQTRLSAIEVIEDWKLGFNLGNCIKYIQRAPYKGQLEDLKKAAWYLQREINNRG